MFRKGLIILLAGLAAVAVAATAYADNSTDAKTAFALSRTGFDARALGMGGAYVALANDAAAGYWNPAGLYMMSEKTTSLTAMYTAGLSFDRFQNYIAVAHRFHSIGLAGTWLNTGIRDVPQYDVNGNAMSAFGDYENIIIGSMGFGSSNAGFGISVKGYLQSLNSEQRNGIGFDVGAQWKATDMLTVAAVFKDLGGKVGGDDNRLPADIRLGLGVRPMEHFNISMDVEKVENQDRAAFLGGAEYGIKFADDAWAFLRGGVNDSHFSAGLGAMVGKLQADYAFTNEKESDFGNAHRVSLTFGF